MTVRRDDVPLADLAEQERELDEAPDPDPGEDLPEPAVVPLRFDADEGDLLEQSMVVTGDDRDDYRPGPDEE